MVTTAAFLEMYLEPNLERNSQLVRTLVGSIEILFVCVEVLRLSQSMGSCRARSDYLTTLLLDRLSPLSC